MDAVREKLEAPLPGVERWRWAGFQVEIGAHPLTGQRRLVVVGPGRRPTLEECLEVVQEFTRDKPGQFAVHLPRDGWPKPVDAASLPAPAPETPADGAEAVPPEIAALRAYQREILQVQHVTVIVQELLALQVEPESQSRVQVAPANALNALRGPLGAAMAGPQRPGPDHPAFRRGGGRR